MKKIIRVLALFVLATALFACATTAPPTTVPKVDSTVVPPKPETASTAVAETSPPLSVYYHSWTDEITFENKQIKHTVTKYEYDNPVSGTPSRSSQSVITDDSLNVQQWEDLKNFIRNCGFEKLGNAYGAPEHERYYPYTLIISWGTERKEVRYRSNPNYGEPPEIFKDIEKYLFKLSKEVRN